jgi:hypothetical protein
VAANCCDRMCRPSFTNMASVSLIFLDLLTSISEPNGVPSKVSASLCIFSSFSLLFPFSRCFSLCLLSGSGGRVGSSTSGGRSFIIESLAGPVDFTAFCGSVLCGSCVRPACGARAFLVTCGVTVAGDICSGVGAVAAFFNLLNELHLV